MSGDESLKRNSLMKCHKNIASYYNTVKPVLSGHSKLVKTKALKTNGILMKAKSIAECSLGAFCNTFDLHLAIIGLENQFLVFFLSGCLRQGLLYYMFCLEL